MHENLFSYIRAEGCCTKCKCVGRESRPRLRGHDRGQHLALAQIKKAVINSETLTAEKKNAMAILSYVLKNVLD